jgi:hypothetical protein
MFISIILNLANKLQSQSNLILHDRERITISATIELQPRDNYNLNWWFQSRLAASQHNSQTKS